MKNLLTVLACAGAMATLTLSAHAQHSHGYVGDADGDGYLDVVSADTGSGTLLLTLPTRTLSYASTGVYADAGFNFNGSYTFSALHGSESSVNNPQGALSGTKIYMTLYSVTGPTGATFAFFEDGGTAPAFTMTTGMTGGSDSFVLTEEAYFELDPSDPYGHIHGRRFAADTFGTYNITWVLTNSESIGTQDSLSNPNAGERFFTQTFNAVPEPTTAVMVGLALATGLFCFRRKKASC